MKERGELGGVSVWAVLALLVLPVLGAAGARADYPEAVVSAFCRHDGYGDRLRPRSWDAIGDLVEWRFEPAWDVVRVITGYEIVGSVAGDEEAEVTVRYAVWGEISGAEVNEAPRLEMVRMRLVVADGSWRIAGVPPVPRVFDSYVNREAMRASLASEESQYLSNSKLAARMLRAAGRDVVHQPAAAVLGAASFESVAEPGAGDVVAYLDRGVPYHLGLYDGDGMIISATINAGAVRTGIKAFAGEVRYLRVRAATPSAVPDASPSPAGVQGRGAAAAKPPSGAGVMGRRAASPSRRKAARRTPAPAGQRKDGKGTKARTTG